jgi:dethiobiotin synthetase
VTDDELVEAVRRKLREYEQRHEERSALALVETAGGIASPAPSGRLQVSLTSPSF